jgi:hypothetical protein
MGVLIQDTSFQLLSPGSADTEAEDWGGAPDAATGYAAVGNPVGGTLYSESGFASVPQEGSTVRYVYKMLCEMCDLKEGMRVRDLVTGLEYEVLDVNPRPKALIPVVEAHVSRSVATW